jgi:hypothetical protein
VVLRALVVGGRKLNGRYEKIMFSKSRDADPFSTISLMLLNGSPTRSNQEMVRCGPCQLSARDGTSCDSNSRSLTSRTT